MTHRTPPARLLAAAAALTLAISFLVFHASSATTASAQTAGIKFPAPQGTVWEVLAGYNTATHEGEDPYALDVWRTDGPTGGTALLAPMDGTIGYMSSSCVSLQTPEVTLLMCHVFPSSGLTRGDAVVAGQPLGVVAPDGQAGNNGVAHIHLQLNYRRDHTWNDGDPIPFAGPWAIEGVEFAETTESNGHAGVRMTSTNAQGAAPVASLDAGADRTVAPGEVVTLTAEGSGAFSVFWVQESGPPVVTQVSAGTSVSFVAPNEPGAVLRFQAIVNRNGSLLTDSVEVTVNGQAAPQQQQQAPSIAAGEVFHGGISIVVFSGGGTEALITALACPLPNLAMWASAPDGTLVQYTMNRPAFVNASWTALFPEGLPAMTPLLVRCD